MKFSNYKNISTIIFDFGGVVINIEMLKTVEAFIQLGIQEKDYANFYQIPFVKEFEKGLISNNDFIKEVKKIFKQDIDNKAIINAWNKLLLDIPDERLELISELRKKHRVILLSNTNSIHIEASNEWLYKNSKYKGLDEVFDKLYLSYQMKMSKPDKEIYLQFLKEENLSPENAIFIDDLKANIDSAKELGINTYLHQSNGDLLTFFRN